MTVMKKLLRVFCAFFALFSALNLSAIDLPALSNVLGIKFFFLPKELNKEVLFTFEKRDNNGRAGSDALAFSVVSPGGETVFEYTIPDDGNAENGWRFGPRQPVEVRFTPTEAGVYTLEFKMECDAYLYFDNTRIENLHVGFTNGNFRTATETPAHLFFYLPVDKVGEAGITHISSNYMHYSQISDMTITDGKTVFYEGFTADPAPDKRQIFTHNFLIRRSDPEAIYELTASKFDVISFAPRLYPTLTFFLTREAAIAFKPYFFKSSIHPNSFEISAENAVKPFALGAGESYMVTFKPATNESYEFTVELLGKSYTFKPGAAGFIVDVPANFAFPEMKITGTANGSFTFSRMVSDRPDIELPADGAVITPVNGKIQCRALSVKDAESYTFTFSHESGATFTVESSEAQTSVPAGRLRAGVWLVSCTPKGGNSGRASCFAIKQPRPTSPVYIFGYKPVIDGKVTEFDQISVQVLRPAVDIDLTKTTFTVNGKAYAVEVLPGNRIGIPAAKIQLEAGKIDIAADIYDHYGNYSHYEWCFMYNADIPKTISFNEDGILIFNGRKFLPLICYPPLNRGDYGFNTTLPNALTTLAQLDVYLRNNMKSLDGGCVYRGFYTEAGSTPLQDVQNFMSGPGGAHPARIGAWMDESDAHVPDAFAKTIVDAFSVPNRGVAGICTTGRQRYADMAKLGDYLMIDIYPRAKVLSVDRYFAKAMRDAAGKPVWQLNQGFDYDWGNRDEDLMIPNKPMLKYAHWAAFRHGLQGLGLYMCGSTKYWSFPGLWQYVIEIYRQANTLSFVLVEPTVRETILTAPSPLTSRVLRFRDRYYLIVQNSSLQAFPAALQITGNFAPEVRVLFEDRIVKLENGRFNDVFQALESRIYELTVR